MKYIVLLLFLLSSYACFSQKNFYGIYITKDPDGWVNIRNEGKIIDKLANNHLVFVFDDIIDENAPWISIEYQKDDSTKYGSIHQSRLKSVTDMQNLPVISKSDDSYSYKINNLKVQIDIRSFDLKNKKLEYSSDGPWLEKINNKKIWGVENDLPKIQYENIEITENGKKYNLPKYAYDDLFEPSLDSTNVFYDNDTQILYIVSLNSDGAGGYLAAWKIKNGKYIDRLVVHGF